MLSLPIMPTQVTLRGNVCSLDVPTVAHSHLALASRVMHREGREWSQKSAKNRESQWYSQFAHSAHTGPRENVGSLDAPIVAKYSHMALGGIVMH